MTSEATNTTDAAHSAAPRTVAIVGAHGGMGRSFTRVFEEQGHRVLAVDVDTALRPAEAAREADVVIVSVPIHATEAVIREVGPHVREDALLTDVTSIKAMPLRVMLESTTAAVAGMHPMFGPGVHAFGGQKVVVCPGRGERQTAFLIETLRRAGFVVTEADAESHDRSMALVQVLTHFQTQVLGLTLARYGVPLEEPLRFTSPAYLLELYVTARHFAQAAELYGPIEMLNPETEKVTRTFLESAREVADILARRDQKAFDGLFAEVSGFFGSFTDEAVDNSGFLIDRLVELTQRRADGEPQGGE